MRDNLGFSFLFSLNPSRIRLYQFLLRCVTIQAECFMSYKPNICCSGDLPKPETLCESNTEKKTKE